MRKFSSTASLIALAALAAACSGGGSEASQSDGSSAVEAVAEVAEEPVLGDLETKDGVAFASLTGDAVAGKTAFAQCASCHAVEAGKNLVGPSLAGIVGAAAGKVEGFNYSPANASLELTWNEEELYVFLENPRRVMPGTKMVYPGQADAQKRADIIAYLKDPS